MAVWILVLLGGQGIGGPMMGWIVDAIGPRDAMSSPAPYGPRGRRDPALIARQAPSR